MKFLFKAKSKKTGKYIQGNYIQKQQTTYCFKEDYLKNPDNTKHYIVYDSMTDWCLPNQHIMEEIDLNTLG